jgi:hypothetical protein
MCLSAHDYFLSSSQQRGFANACLHEGQLTAMLMDKAFTNFTVQCMLLTVVYPEDV